MKLEIDQEILDLSDRCTKDRRCLSGRPEDLCEAEMKLFGDQHFICKNRDICSYKLPFGSSFFCTCPVRRAIYDQYGK
jgi:hypothetical protein